jgi:signal transduction histidine kinase
VTVLRPRAARPRAGLRGQLVVALVATSLATLAVAALTVVPLLEHRLEADRLADLRGLARTARPALRAVPEAELRRGSPSLRRLAAHLQRRTGGRIAVFDEGDVALADTAPAGGGAPAITGLPRLRALARRHRDGVASTERARHAYAVTVVRDGHDRLTLVLVKRLDDTRAAASVVRGALPPAALAGLAVALALALLLSRRLLGRLRRLQVDARALGDEGLAHPVAVGGQDEVAEVAAALEAMRARLVAEEASRQDFVATASHELRTPLASLRATLELLREEVASGRAEPSATVARADTALRQTHRLVGLATDLLDLSRLDGAAPLHPEPLELRELAGLVAREAGEDLARSGRTLRVEGGPALTVADPAAVARIVGILLDNAARHGAGDVTVGVEGDARAVRLTVADQGPGLAEDEREHVFHRFARGRGSSSAPGAGLGLAIARGMARAMGGDVAAPPGVPASRFVVSLPPWHGGPGDEERGPALHPAAQRIATSR